MIMLHQFYNLFTSTEEKSAPIIDVSSNTYFVNVSVKYIILYFTD